MNKKKENYCHAWLQ